MWKLYVLLIADALHICVGMSRAGTVYFLVTELPGRASHHDSFVLPISNEADIAHARDIIARGPEAAGAWIAQAAVARGADGINRDYLASGKPQWSWHVTNFEAWVDLTAEIYDSWPSYVEENFVSYSHDTSGHIGFWSYTVSRELAIAPPIAVPLPAAELAGLPMVGGAIALQLWRRRAARLRGIP